MMFSFKSYPMYIYSPYFSEFATVLSQYKSVLVSCQFLLRSIYSILHASIKTVLTKFIVNTHCS